MTIEKSSDQKSYLMMRNNFLLSQQQSMAEAAAFQEGLAGFGMLPVGIPSGSLGFPGQAANPMFGQPMEYSAGPQNALPVNFFGGSPPQMHPAMINHDYGHAGGYGHYNQFLPPQQPLDVRLDPNAPLPAGWADGFAPSQPIAPPPLGRFGPMLNKPPGPNISGVLPPGRPQPRQASDSPAALQQSVGAPKSRPQRVNQVLPPQVDQAGPEKSKEATQKIKKRSQPLKFVSKKK